MMCPEVSLTRHWVQLCRDRSLAFYFGPEEVSVKVAETEWGVPVSGYCPPPHEAVAP